MPHTQSVVFRRPYDLDEAKHWLRRHGFVHTDVDVTPHTYRFRQHTPDPKKRYVTKDLGKMFLVLTYP